MGKPAARVGDMHTCPMMDGPKPHVGGPIMPPGSVTVLIGGMPAAVMGGLCTCVSPAPDSIILGSMGVLIGGQPAARMGDMTAHGGTIVLGCFTVLIGETWVLTPFQAANQAALEQALFDSRQMLLAKQKELETWDAAAKANVKTWLGDDSDATKEMLTKRIDAMIDAMDKMTVKNFEEGDTTDPDFDDTFAYVYPNDKDHKIYLGGAFSKAPATGSDSKAGTLIHETSHFSDVAGTKDVKYGTNKCKDLAKNNPADSQKNADSFEFYIEH